jgi:hypothetical protein
MGRNNASADRAEDRFVGSPVALTLSFLALVWALWFTQMIRYPTRWAKTIDAIHLHLARYGLSSERMKRLKREAC